jgi:hypothetical protein
LRNEDPDDDAGSQSGGGLGDTGGG